MSDLSVLAQFAFFSMLIVWLFGAFGSVLIHENERLAATWSMTCALLGSFFGVGSALAILFAGEGFMVVFPPLLSVVVPSFFLDKLAAFFLFTISLIGALSSLYGYGYVRHFIGTYSIGGLGFFYNFFLIGLALVVSAHHALFFLIAWELMTLASYFLVVFERNKEENVAAGSRYFVMAHVGTACIILAFLLLYRATGSFDFGVIHSNIDSVSPLLLSGIFALALVGFGTKAGVVPLHVWLPSAHPAAPSFVSALMSGVMIKTGIYMFIRLFFDMFGSQPISYGVILLLAGALSSFLGVLYALTEHDIKRLLAYHSIENIGIILLGVGCAMIFRSQGALPLAILALTAALFHTLNHAIFKALLFLGAGSVVLSTHTRNIEAYGGLIRLMPYTALFFLVGSLAISGLPPFNGFASEWLTFQSLFAGITSAGGLLRVAFLFATASLAATGGLAALCFVKAFGTTFLARPRSAAAESACEAGLSLRAGMAMLALLTLFIGLSAGPVTHILTGVVHELAPFTDTGSALASTEAALVLKNGFAEASLPLIFLALVLVALATFGAVALATRTRRAVVSRTWDCGTELGPRMEITATGFSRSIIMVFKSVLRPTTHIGYEYREASLSYLPAATSVEMGTNDLYQTYLYQPIERFFGMLSLRIRKIQGGSVNLYVLYILLTVLALMFFTN